MRSSEASLSVHTGSRAIRSHPGWRRFHALPVVDGRGKLRGVLRYETLRQIEAQFAADRGPGSLAVALGLMEVYWTAALGAIQGAAGLARSLATGNLKEEARNGS